jgi:hypothetical protein
MAADADVTNKVTDPLPNFIPLHARQNVRPRVRVQSHDIADAYEVSTKFIRPVKESITPGERQEMIYKNVPHLCCQVDGNWHRDIFQLRRGHRGHMCRYTPRMRTR